MYCAYIIRSFIWILFIYVCLLSMRQMKTGNVIHLVFIALHRNDDRSCICIISTRSSTCGYDAIGFIEYVIETFWTMNMWSVNVLLKSVDWTESSFEMRSSSFRMVSSSNWIQRFLTEHLSAVYYYLHCKRIRFPMATARIFVCVLFFSHQAEHLHTFTCPNTWRNHNTHWFHHNNLSLLFST